MSRGSFSVGQADGGLPPDEIVEDEDDILAVCERIFDAYHEAEPGGMVRIDLAPCSPFSVSPRLMEESAAMARRKGALLHTHLAETKDEEAFCLETYGRRPVQYVADLGWTGPDTWYAHAVHLDDEEIALMGATGTGVAHCPSSNARLGSGIARLGDMLGAGVPVGLGVDGSASNDSSHMLAEARMAMLFQRAVRGADAMTATQALELATLGGAGVLRRDDIGTLAPGKAADLVGFDLRQIELAGALHDPVAALVFCTPPTVDFSIINGRQVVTDGRPVGMDLDEIVANHNRLASEIMARTETRHGRSFTDRTWRRLETGNAGA
jgi:cytosine/adenosine deaminase-related metal-dependent hydrolase